MNPISSLWVICMFIEIVDMGILSSYNDMGHPFVCFYCHQTTDECNDGHKMSLNHTNCSTNKCFVLKYETQMPGVNVLATFRGCLQEPESEIMRSVKTEHHTVTEKHFHSCNYTMCNNADKQNRFNMIIFINIVVSFFTKMLLF